MGNIWRFLNIFTAQLFIMKKLLILPLLFLHFTSSAQTADDIIAKFTAEMGGLEKYRAVKTVIMTGKIRQQGMEFSVSIRIINGKAVRTDVDAMGTKIIEAYKNGEGWKKNPLSGNSGIIGLTAAELNSFKNQTQISGKLMDYKARGNKVELSGTEMVEGIKTHKIKLTAGIDSSVIFYYIMVENSLIVKTTEKRKFGNEEAEVETFLSDFREVGGMKFAFSQIQKIGGQVFMELVMETVELDKAIDEKIFDRPAN
jgi:predicted RNA-binding protein with PIN domain